MPIDPKNRGVQSPQLAELDFIAGQETGIQYEEVNAAGDWTLSLPKRETQFINTFDTQACVTFSALNIIEMQLNYFLASGKLSPDKVKKLTDWGFIEDGKFNFSDRFTAKMSGTTPQGNSLQKVWDSIRKDGLLPELMWKSQGALNWADYYKEIPQQIKDYAKNILTIFEFKYEWVVTGNCAAPNLELLKYHLKQAPLQPAHPLCARDSQGVFQPCNVCVTQHATSIYNIISTVKDFDHYYPYENEYALNYTFPWVMKAVVLLKKDEIEQPPFSYTFTQDILIEQRSTEVLMLQKALNVLGYKIPILPDAMNRGYYGQITRAAVKDFQYKYSVANLIVLKWNNGRFVYGQTRAKLNLLLNGI